MNEVKLLPYRSLKVLDTATEIPKGIRVIEAPSLWDETDEGKGNVIAIIDTGCDPDHPDLKDRIIEGKNFTTDYDGDKENFRDNDGHGTHVAGTVAANRNGRGVTGVSPSANLLILKVLTGKGIGRIEWIVEAIHYAAKWRGPAGEKVRVISMSLGGPVDAPELHKAVQTAVAKNISIVCAAGNAGDGRGDTFEYAYPGSYSEVIQVGAVDFNLRIAPFTNTNDEIDLVAPGVNILSTYPGGKYARLSGTSMAAPHVSGALALLINLAEKRFKRPLTEAEIFSQLIKRTVSLGYSNAEEGNGLLALGLQEKLENLFSTYYASK